MSEPTIKSAATRTALAQDLGTTFQKTTQRHGGMFGYVSIYDKLTIENDATVYQVDIKAPTTATESTALTLPATVGAAGQLLSTSGSGVLTWSSQGNTTWTGLTNSNTPAIKSITLANFYPDPQNNSYTQYSALTTSNSFVNTYKQTGGSATSQDSFFILTANPVFFTEDWSAFSIAVPYLVTGQGNTTPVAIPENSDLGITIVWDKNYIPAGAIGCFPTVHQGPTTVAVNTVLNSDMHNERFAVFGGFDTHIDVAGNGMYNNGSAIDTSTDITMTLHLSWTGNVWQGINNSTDGVKVFMLRMNWLKA